MSQASHHITQRIVQSTTLSTNRNYETKYWSRITTMKTTSKWKKVAPLHLKSVTYLQCYEGHWRTPTQASYSSHALQSLLPLNLSHRCGYSFVSRGRESGGFKLGTFTTTSSILSWLIDFHLVELQNTFGCCPTCLHPSTSTDDMLPRCWSKVLFRTLIWMCSCNRVHCIVARWHEMVETLADWWLRFMKLTHEQTAHHPQSWRCIAPTHLPDVLQWCAYTVQQLLIYG